MQILGIIFIIHTLDCQTPFDQDSCPSETLMIYAIKAWVWEIWKFLLDSYRCKESELLGLPLCFLCFSILTVVTLIWHFQSALFIC